jgi:predicted nucleic acid-binding protein
MKPNLVVNESRMRALRAICGLQNLELLDWQDLALKAIDEFIEKEMEKPPNVNAELAAVFRRGLPGQQRS